MRWAVTSRLSFVGAVLHAVNMAVLNRNAASLKDCTVYVTLYPDNDCAKSIIQSKIKTVVYWLEKKPQDVDNPTKAAKRMLEWSQTNVRSVNQSTTIISTPYSAYFCFIGDMSP